MRETIELQKTHEPAEEVALPAAICSAFRGLVAVGLDNPKTSENIAGVLRACGCYGATMLAVSGPRYKKHGCDVQKDWRKLPLIHADLREVIPYGSTPVAVELVDGAESLVDFVHPKHAYYVFGAEDNTLGERVLSWCPRRVMIPTRACMNLAACVNVVLYDRLQKQTRNLPQNAKSDS